MKYIPKKSHMHPLLLVLIGLTIASFIGLYYKISQTQDTKIYEGQLHSLSTGSAFLSKQVVPQLNFITDTQEPWISPDSLKAWSVFFFGYAQCPAFCPEILEQMDRIGQSLPPGQIDFYFVSIDPANDTPVALHKFLSQYHTPITGLTGELQDIQALAQFFKLHVEEASGQQEHIEHASALALMDPDGYACGLFRDLNAPMRVAEDLLYIIGSIEFVHDAQSPQ